MKKSSMLFKGTLMLALIAAIGMMGILPVLAADDEVPTKQEIVDALFATIDAMPNLTPAEKDFLKSKILSVLEELEGVLDEQAVISSLVCLYEVLKLVPDADMEDLEDAYKILKKVAEHFDCACLIPEDFCAAVMEYIEAGYSLEDAFDAAFDDLKGEDEDKEGFPAAPSIAAMLLKGIGNKSAKGKAGINYISAVARHMGPGTDFDGIAKEEAGYAEAVLEFLRGLGADI